MPSRFGVLDRAPRSVGRDANAQQRETDLIRPMAEKGVEFGGRERRGKTRRLKHGRATKAADDLLGRRRVDLRRGGSGGCNDAQRQGERSSQSSDRSPGSSIAADCGRSSPDRVSRWFELWD